MSDLKIGLTSGESSNNFVPFLSPEVLSLIFQGVWSGLGMGSTQKQLSVHLPPEILLLIFKKVFEGLEMKGKRDFYEILKLREVCQTWKSVLSTHCSSFQNVRPNPNWTTEFFLRALIVHNKEGKREDKEEVWANLATHCSLSGQNAPPLKKKKDDWWVTKFVLGCIGR